MPITQPDAKRNSSQGKTASKTAKPNTIHMSLSLREEVKLNQTENAWVPTAAKKATKSEVVKTKNEEEQKNDEVNKSVRSILNKITPDNTPSLTERFKALPIDTIERLEKTIDLVFEKAIEEQSFAPLYSYLCAAMQSVQVSSKDGKKTSFKKLIISKCQSLFELDKAQEMDSAKKLTEINSCKDPEKKKELQLEFEENERRLRKRSVGNCRFIGELFKQKILTPNIMLYCIVNLVTKHDEEPLECLCILLKTVGKELEQSYDLNDTFEKLTALSFSASKSKISSRIQIMIHNVIDLRRHKWINEKQDCLRSGGYKSHRETKNEWNVSQNNTKSNKNTKIDDKINLKCINLLYEYEQMQNLDDIIYSLSKDKISVIRTRHEEFVKSMSFITLKNISITQSTVAGKIFAELLFKKILSMDAITRGIDAVLKDWNDYLMDYPQFFSYIAAIIAPLLLSQNASFDFNNLIILKMKLTKNKLLYNILQCWICTNISEEIIKTPFFVKSLTIAILIVCLKLNHSYEDFFDPVHVKLLSHFIEFEPLPVHEIQAREVQCMYGIQIISATLKHPGGMVLKLFNKLYHHRVISKESFELFIQDYEEITEK